MPEWQAIETAPQDGSFIIGQDSYLGGDRAPVPYVCRWLDWRWVTTANDVIAVFPVFWPPAAEVIAVCPGWWLPLHLPNHFVDCYAEGNEEPVTWKP